MWSFGISSSKPETIYINPPSMHYKTMLARPATSAALTNACSGADRLCLTQPSKTKARRLPVGVDASPSSTFVTTASIGDDDDEEDAAAKKRFQYKMYQRHHRARQQEKTRRLEAQVEELTQEVAGLMETHDGALQRRAEASPTCHHSPSQFVREYLHLFEHGYAASSCAAQEEFVRRMMAPTVYGPHFTGVDELLEQWRLYTHTFAAVHIVVRDFGETRLDHEQTLVTVSITLKLEIHRGGIVSVFPSVQDYADILEDLVSSPLVVNGSLRFVMDATNTVRWLGAEMEYVDAMVDALGSLERACLCLNGSLLDTSTGHLHSGGSTVQPLEEHTPPPTTSTSTTTDRLDLSFLMADAEPTE